MNMCDIQANYGEETCVTLTYNNQLIGRVYYCYSTVYPYEVYDAYDQHPHRCNSIEEAKIWLMQFIKV